MLLLLVVDGAAVDVGVLLLFYVDVLLLFLLLLIPLSVLLTLMRCFENCIHYVRNKILGVGVESFCQEYKFGRRSSFAQEPQHM